MRKVIGRQKVPNYISLKVGDEMKRLIAKAADERDVPMNEAIVQILAEHFGREDLAFVPRKSFGRPRRELVGV